MSQTLISDRAQYGIKGNLTKEDYISYDINHDLWSQKVTLWSQTDGNLWPSLIRITIPAHIKAHLPLTVEQDPEALELLPLC